MPDVQEQVNTTQSQSHESAESKPIEQNAQSNEAKSKKKKEKASPSLMTGEMAFTFFFIALLVLGAFNYGKGHDNYVGYLTSDVADTLYDDNRLEGEQLTDIFRNSAKHSEESIKAVDNVISKYDIRVSSMVKRVYLGGD